MQITGTHFNYYIICKRKLWLFANGITMESTSDLVSQGKLIHETTYQQRSERFKEIEVKGVKIDFYDPKNKIIHEIKKSDKRQEAHIWQLKYYIYMLEQEGIEMASGVLEYPKLRKTEEVYLSDIDRDEIKHILEKIENTIQSDDCPNKLPMTKCRNCSYSDFCWSGEDNNTTG
ncbi:MAG: CRISPR-associated protein Cas4 [Bacteroidetes bacterium]|nr:CRISPR-associated protein Cas4 [Bacteroidota bacterium]